MNTVKAGSFVIFFLVLLGIAALVFLPGEFFSQDPETGAPRTVLRVLGRREDGRGGPALPLIPLAQGETVAALLTLNFDDDPQDEQVLACRNLLNPEGPLSLVYVDFNPLQGYRRAWTTETDVARPGAVSLSTLDIIGDGGICVILRSLGTGGEETLAIARKTPAGEEPFRMIAELRIQGSISLEERGLKEPQLEEPRPQSPRSPLKITASGRADDSSNPRDRVELTLSYNPERGRYEQSRRIIIPGAQIEERRFQELLSGGTRGLEEFMDGLWYFLDPQGTPDTGQYLSFDTANREIVFYGDETEQVFAWERSGRTRSGVYISTHNQSVTTIKRFIEVELDSLDRLRLRVIEDVSLKIGVSTAWDGYYRKAGTFAPEGPGMEGPGMEGPASLPPHITASYDSPIGRFAFDQDGTYALLLRGGEQRGRYAFFRLEGKVFLELRPSPESREVYRVRENPEGLILDRVRLGIRGAQELHELPLILRSPVAVLGVSLHIPQ